MSRTPRLRRNRLGRSLSSFALRPLGLEALECRRLLAADINLQGNAISIANNDLTPAVADGTDYGSLQVSVASTPRTFTVQNVGDMTLTLNGTPLVSIGGANAGDFTVTSQPASASVAATGQTTFQLRFTPTAVGLRTATVTIASDDADEGTYVFAVQGTGVAAPEIALADPDGTPIASGDTTPSAAESTDFGTVDTQFGLRAQSFVISNSGAGPLTLSGTPLVAIAGANAGDFTVVTQPTGGTINTGGQQTLTIQFNPSANGLRTATVSIANNDPDESPYTFAIQGTGANLPKIAVSNLALVNIANGDITPSAGDSTDFGLVNTAAGSQTQTYAISNLGSGTLNLSGTPRVIVGGANAADFTVTVQPPSSIAAGTNSTFVVRFDPSADGVRRATLTIANDDATGNPFTFDIQGTGGVVAQRGRIAVSSFTGTIINSGDTTPSPTDTTDFGTVDTAGGLRTQTFAISNFGPGTLNLTGTPRVAISGAHAADFSVVALPPTAIESNTNRTFAIQFNPSAAGTRTATVTIASDDDTASTYTFAIQGNGGSLPEITLSSFVGSVEILSGDAIPGTGDGTDFGAVDVSSGLVNRTFVISNLGTSSLTLSGDPRVAIGGANAADFTVVAPPPASVAANSNQTFGIQFNPSAAGTRTATVTIANSDGDEGSYTFTIQGTGASAAEIVLGSLDAIIINSGDTTPSTADGTDFGNVDLFSSGKDQRFVITNFGGSALNLTGNPRVQISGVDASQFSVVTLPPATVGSAANATFDVRFTPNGVGARTATVTIANDDSDEGSYTFAIRGTGTTASNRQISVTALDGHRIENGATSAAHFGEATINGGATTTRYTITNQGDAALNLTGAPRVTVGGPHAGDFLVTRQPVGTVAVNGTTTFDVTFQPIGAGERTAIISFASDDANESPFSFTVHGTSTTLRTPEIKVIGAASLIIADGDATPSADDQTAFGSVTVGQSAARTFTIENEGALSLGLAGGAVSIGGANAADFTVTQQPAASLPHGASSALTITFRPSAVGTRTATVTIRSNDFDEGIFTFDISGEGLAASA